MFVFVCILNLLYYLIEIESRVLAISAAFLSYMSISFLFIIQIFYFILILRTYNNCITMSLLGWVILSLVGPFATMAWPRIYVSKPVCLWVMLFRMIENTFYLYPIIHIWLSGYVSVELFLFKNNIYLFNHTRDNNYMNNINNTINNNIINYTHTHTQTHCSSDSFQIRGACVPMKLAPLLVSCVVCVVITSYIATMLKLFFWAYSRLVPTCLPSPVPLWTHKHTHTHTHTHAHKWGV
eukprot:GHVR01119628.1.p1 GENE.GHVR01119628.1~~GHVR01119628.1.p1  ORF type:complete len:254 (+),score=99.15 GHVR01119628.1:50-763(+)